MRDKRKKETGAQNIPNRAPPNAGLFLTEVSAEVVKREARTSGLEEL